MLKGPVVLTIEGQSRTLEKGDSHPQSASLPHRFHNPIDHEVSFVRAVMPIALRQRLRADSLCHA